MENHIHIGRMIKNYLKEKNISVQKFAASLKISRVSAYKIFKKQHINTAILFEINQALEYDFLNYLTENRRDAMHCVSTDELIQELQQCKQKNDELQKEVDYLKKIIAILEK